MKMPIVVYNWGDMLFFATVGDAERHLEAVDVQNGEYLAFDSDGHILEVLTVPQTDRVMIRPVTSQSSFAPQLRYVLLQWLRFFQVPASELSHADLPRLVDMAKSKDPRGISI